MFYNVRSERIGNIGFDGNIYMVEYRRMQTLCTSIRLWVCVCVCESMWSSLPHERHKVDLMSFTFGGRHAQKCYTFIDLKQRNMNMDYSFKYKPRWRIVW